jgi:hypothetical protein
MNAHEQEVLDAVLAYIDEGFYPLPVHSYVGDGRESDGKKPAVRGWQLSAAPTTPPDATEAVARFGPGGSHVGFNVGLATGWRWDHATGTARRWTAVDLDKNDGKDGVAEMKRLAADNGLAMKDFNTRAAKTASGGMHLLYEPEGALKNDAGGVQGYPGIDVRSEGGMIVVAPSVVAGKSYEWYAETPLVPMGALEALFPRRGSSRGRAIDRTPSKADPVRAEKLAVDVAKGWARGVEGSRNNEAYRLAARLVEIGCPKDAIEPMIAEHWRCDPPLDDDELHTTVQSAYKTSQTAPGSGAVDVVFAGLAAPEGADTGTHPLDKLNGAYAFVQAGGHILHETTDARGRFTLHHLSLSAFHLWFKNKPIQMGKKSAPLSEAWLEWAHRREFDSIVFAPGRAVDPRFYNLWRGFSVEPAATADHPMVKRFLEHALQNVCGGDKKLFKWLIGYFAHMVQRPWEKPLVALVFKGAKGTGKNALIERLAYLLGNHAFIADDRRYLLGNFNGHFENCLLFVLDEATWAGDKQGEGRLKGLITGKSHTIEHKGEQPYVVDNLTRVVIIGNEKWLVPATEDERRYAVFEVGNGRRQDRPYFQEMREGLDERGGAAHLLRYLMDYDLSGIDVNAAPDTIGLANQKAATLVGPALFVHECASIANAAGEAWTYEGMWLEKNALFEAYVREAKANRNKYPPKSKTAFWFDVYELFPELATEKHRNRRPAGCGRQVDLPPLREARRRLVDKLGVPDVWTEEPDEIIASTSSRQTAGMFQ